MNHNEICDNCMNYYGYGLTEGICMIFFITSDTPMDKKVKYTDSCPSWIFNDDPNGRKLMRDAYLWQKNYFAELKRKSKKEAGLL